jgi:hypothetical protein
MVQAKKSVAVPIEPPPAKQPGRARRSARAVLNQDVSTYIRGAPYRPLRTRGRTTLAPVSWSAPALGALALREQGFNHRADDRHQTQMNTD